MNEFQFEDLVPFEPNVIELLGFAKNNISEAKTKMPNISSVYLDRLNKAHSLLHEVQEYLYTI